MPPTPEQRIAAAEPLADDRLAMRQCWDDLCFLHWEAPAEEIQSRLPEGLRVDTYDDRAYLGIVPFSMRKVRPHWFFPVPWLSNFLELNLRTYVYDAAGEPAVWFFSLDANQPIAVEIARRFFHLPYVHARMSATRGSGGQLTYRCGRRDLAAAAEYVYPPAGESAQAAEPGSLEHFLLERYRFFSWDAKRGRLLRGQVAHAPYRYQLLERRDWDTAPMRWNGFEIGGEAMHAAVAHAVEIDAFAVREVVPRSASG